MFGKANDTWTPNPSLTASVTGCCDLPYHGSCAHGGFQRLCLMLGPLALDSSSPGFHLCPLTGPASVWLQHDMVRAYHAALANTTLKWREKTNPYPRYTHFLGCEQKGYTVQLQYNCSALSLLILFFSASFFSSMHISLVIWVRGNWSVLVRQRFIELLC